MNVARAVLVALGVLAMCPLQGAQACSVMVPPANEWVAWDGRLALVSQPARWIDTGTNATTPALHPVNYFGPTVLLAPDASRYVVDGFDAWTTACGAGPHTELRGADGAILARLAGEPVLGADVGFFLSNQTATVLHDWTDGHALGMWPASQGALLAARGDTTVWATVPDPAGLALPPEGHDGNVTVLSGGSARHFQFGAEGRDPGLLHAATSPRTGRIAVLVPGVAEQGYERQVPTWDLWTLDPATGKTLGPSHGSGRAAGVVPLGDGWVVLAWGLHGVTADGRSGPLAWDAPASGNATAQSMAADPAGERVLVMLRHDLDDAGRRIVDRLALRPAAGPTQDDKTGSPTSEAAGTGAPPVPTGALALAALALAAAARRRLA